MPGQKSFIENRRLGLYTDKYSVYVCTKVIVCKVCGVHLYTYDPSHICLHVNLHLVNNCTQQSVESQLPLYLEYLDLSLLNIFSRIISRILPLCMHFDVYLQVSSAREHEPTGYL